jgi:hypothetical protein
MPSRSTQDAAVLLKHEPDARVLHTAFRFRQLEPLLNQAATLVEQCLADVRDYGALDYAWNQFQIELATETKDLDLDQQRAEFLDRDKVVAEKRLAFQTNSEAEMKASVDAATKLEGFGTGSNPPQGEPGHARAEQNLHEKKVQLASRAWENDLLQKQKEWGTQDVDYGTKKLANRAEALKRRQALTGPGQPFALDQQRDLVFERLQRNYVDALDRAAAAQIGLERVLGWKVDAPKLPPPQGGGESTVQIVVSHLANWVRDRLEGLVALQQREHSFTRIVSVRALVGEVEWQRLRRADVGPPPGRCDLLVPIGQATFVGFEGVRLRSVAAWLLGGVAGFYPWALSVAPPKSGLYLRGGKAAAVDQGDLGRCVLGRVEHRNSVRPVDLCGQIALLNTSPFGPDTPAQGPDPNACWSVHVLKPTDASESFSKLEDIGLELSCLGTPAEPGQVLSLLELQRLRDRSTAARKDGPA